MSDTFMVGGYFPDLVCRITLRVNKILGPKIFFRKLPKSAKCGPIQGSMVFGAEAETFEAEGFRR